MEIRTCKAISRMGYFMKRTVARLSPSVFRSILRSLRGVRRRLFSYNNSLTGISGGQRLGLAGRSMSCLRAGVSRLVRRTPGLREFVLPKKTPTSTSVRVTEAMAQETRQLIISLGGTSPRASTITLGFLGHLSSCFFTLTEIIGFHLGRGSIRCIHDTGMFHRKGHGRSGR